VKRSLFTSMQLSTLLGTLSLSTMFVMPLVPAARYDAARATVVRVAQVWERAPYSPGKVEPRRDLRLPQTVAPIDKSCGPDAVMIKPGKARAKIIRV
jgi:hypothetical protein